MKFFGKKKDENKLDQDKAKPKTVAHPELKVISGSSVSKSTPTPTQPPAEPEQDELIPHVDNVIIVASGKGGVGKSVNIAIALSEICDKVGLLDSDVYGPSIPTMMGIREQPKTNENKKLIPLKSHNISLMSIGFMVSEEQALIWRGLMIHSAIRQMLGDVIWDDLDYLVIDMPPGTGDAQLSLSQTLPLTGAIIVTTPQDVALADVRRSIGMCNRMNVPMLGIIENMSYFISPENQKRVAIFGSGGGKKMSEDLGIPLLGQIPIDPKICECGDLGVPITVAYPESPQSEAFRHAAQQLIEQVKEIEQDDLTIT